MAVLLLNCLHDPVRRWPACRKVCQQKTLKGSAEGNKANGAATIPVNGNFGGILLDLKVRKLVMVIQCLFEVMAPNRTLINNRCSM